MLDIQRPIAGPIACLSLWYELNDVGLTLR